MVAACISRQQASYHLFMNERDWLRCIVFLSNSQWATLKTTLGEIAEQADVLTSHYKSGNGDGELIALVMAST